MIIIASHISFSQCSQIANVTSVFALYIPPPLPVFHSYPRELEIGNVGCQIGRLEPECSVLAERSHIQNSITRYPEIKRLENYNSLL